MEGYIKSVIDKHDYAINKTINTTKDEISRRISTLEGMHDQ